MELICSVLEAQRLYSPEEKELLEEPPSSLNSTHDPSPNQTAVWSDSGRATTLEGNNEKWLKFIACLKVHNEAITYLQRQAVTADRTSSESCSHLVCRQFNLWLSEQQISNAKWEDANSTPIYLIVISMIIIINTFMFSI